MSYSQKIYPNPHITPSAPPEDQAYRLSKIDEQEKFLRSEVACRDKLSKKFKRRSAVMTVSDHVIISAITVLGGSSIVTLTTGVGIPVSIILASAGLVLGLSTAIAHKTQRIFASKAKNMIKSKCSQNLSSTLSQAWCQKP